MIQLIDIEKHFLSRQKQNSNFDNKNNQDKNNQIQILKKVNLTVEKGEILGIIGKSGAGKSTLLRCINLLEKPNAGQVIVDGVSLMELDPKALRLARKNMGMIFQSFNLLNSATVFKNVAFPLELLGLSKEKIAARVHHLLEITGILDKEKNYPAELSGGQKQRVAIARALATAPKVLLCDEPTSSLDSETTTSILNLLKQMNQKLGVTIVIISHEEDALKSICNRIVTLNKGEILKEGEICIKTP